MNNLILFLNSFMSYALAFIFIIALCLIACFIGINMRKRKNAAMQTEEGNETTVS